jgi:hypothetical protein
MSFEEWKKQNEELSGFEAWSQQNTAVLEAASAAPEVAAKIAEKETPSRNDFKKLGLPVFSASERKQLSALFSEGGMAARIPEGTGDITSVRKSVQAPPITAATPYSFPRFKPQSKLWEQTKKSWQRGGQAVDIDFMWSKVARGEIDEAQAIAAEKEYSELIKSDPIKARNWLENLYLKTVQIARPMGEGTLKGAKYGTAAATTAAVAGQSGPQVAVPEEVVTMPSAFAIGQTVGSVKYWAEQGHGLIYREARKQGLTHETAQAAAAAGGPLYAYIEYSQVDKIIPGMRKIKGRLLKKAIQVGLDTAKEIGEEGVQRVVTDGSVAIGKLVEGQIGASDVPAETKQMAINAYEEMIEAAGPMALLQMPRAAIAVGEGIITEKGPPAATLPPVPVSEEKAPQRPVEGQTPAVATDRTQEAPVAQPPAQGAQKTPTSKTTEQDVSGFLRTVRAKGAVAVKNKIRESENSGEIYDRIKAIGFDEWQQLTGKQKVDRINQIIDEVSQAQATPETPIEGIKPAPEAETPAEAPKKPAEKVEGVFEYQDTKAEPLLKPLNKKAAGFEVIIEGSGDILREFAQYENKTNIEKASTSYIQEKLRRIDRWLKAHEEGTAFEDETQAFAQENAADVLGKITEAYENQPTKTNGEEAARRLSVAIAKGDYGLARQLHNFMRDNLDKLINENTTTEKGISKAIPGETKPTPQPPKPEAPKVEPAKKPAEKVKKGSQEWFEQGLAKIKEKLAKEPPKKMGMKVGSIIQNRNIGGKAEILGPFEARVEKQKGGRAVDLYSRTYAKIRYTTGPDAGRETWTPIDQWKEIKKPTPQPPKPEAPTKVEDTKALKAKVQVRLIDYSSGKVNTSEQLKLMELLKANTIGDAYRKAGAASRNNDRVLLQKIWDTIKPAEEVKPEAPKVEPAKKPKSKGLKEKPAAKEAKRIVSKEAYEKAKKRLTDRGTLRTGIDPQGFADILTIGVYHFESGVRKFADWSAKMIEEFGVKVKPHLQAVFDQIPNARERGFITSVKEKFPEMANKVAGQYIPRSTDYNELAEATKDQAAKKTFYEKAADIAHSAAANLTELGRAIQAASILGRMTPEGQLRFAARTINKHNETLKRGRKKLPKLTAEQTKEILKRARAIEKMPDGETKAKAFWELQNYIADLVPTPLWKKLINVWKAGLLTGIKTSMLNTFSNLAHGISEVAKDIPATGFDIMFSLVTKKRTVGLTARGVPSGLKKGAAKGWRYLKTGFDERNVAAKLDYHRVNMGKSKFARAVGFYTDGIFRMMGAEDQPFYYGALARSLYSQAIADAKNKGLKGKEAKTFIENQVENPTDTMLNYAVNDALIAVYQNKTWLGKVGKKFQEMPVIGEVIAPFVRTPSAVAMQIIHYSPAGVVSTAIENIGKGKFDQRLLSQGLARGLLGTGILYLGTKLFAMGLMALGYPKGERERKLWEIEGRKPNSIKIDGKWRDVQVLGPIGPLLLIGGYFQQALDSTGSPTEAMSTAMFGGAKSFSEQTFVRGVSAFAKAVSDPERSFESFYSSLGGSIVPTIIADIARATDTGARRSKGPVQRMQVRIPGLKQVIRLKLCSIRPDRSKSKRML